MKRGVTVLLVAAMTIIFSACGWKNEITIEQNAEPEPPLFVENTEIKVVVPSEAETPYQEDWKLWQYLGEESGVNLSVDARASKDYEIVVTLMLSDPKSAPDLLYLQDLNMLEKDHYKALVPLDEHLDLMPNYTAALANIPSHEKREAMTLARRFWEGKLYSPIVLGTSDLEVKGWMYREDVFRKHDLAAPQTIEELYEVCLKLKRLYPDSYPLMIPGKLEAVTLLAPAFQSHLDYGVYYDFETEEWRFGAQEPAMKELVAWLLKMKRAGLVHPNITALDQKTYERLMAEKKAFITIDSLWRQFEFGMTAMMPPRANTENGKNKVGRLDDAIPGYVVCDSNKEARILNAIRFLDLFYSEEVCALLSWGKEGETYEVDSSGVKHWLLDEGETAKSKYGFATAGLLQCVEEAAYNEFLTNGNPVDCSAAKYSELSVNPSRWLVGNKEEREVLEEYQEQLYSYCEEMLVRFIGDMVPLSEWDTFVQECENYHADKVLLAYENAWKRLGQ